MHRARVPRTHSGPPEWEYLPHGWKTRDVRIRGWNEQSVLDAQRSKWPDFLQSLRGAGPLARSHEANSPARLDYSAHNTHMAFGYVLGRAAHNRDSLAVLDWRGGVGPYSA